MLHVPVSLSHPHRERRLGLRWAFTEACSRNFRSCWPWSPGLCLCGQAGSSEAQGCLTGCPWSPQWQDREGYFFLVPEQESRDGLSRFQHRSAALAQGLLAPGNALSSVWPSLDWAALWTHYVEL